MMVEAFAILKNQPWIHRHPLQSVMQGRTELESWIPPPSVHCMKIYDSTFQIITESITEEWEHQAEISSLDAR